MNYQNFDYTLLTIMASCIVAGFYTIIRNYHDYRNYNKINPLLLIGIICIAVSTAALLIKNTNIDRSVLYSLYLLKKVSLHWVYRGLIAWGYVFIAWWVLAFVTVTINKLGKHTKK